MFNGGLLWRNVGYGLWICVHGWAVMELGGMMGILAWMS